ncbi:G-alpha-domain-containing protein [Phanerochaete sordida]|uniref:G-alpha-domain-containing protein n=1 Tax=Phanerochaete sordida TaxID=48140 RepID=A0A9P3GHG5_9APHY|nr:G-alpha-domain-containing protein [Phanerochaete sordida]
MPRTEDKGNEWPPRSATEADIDSWEERLEEEREAKRVNDEIDRLIELERQELKKRKPQAKLLLLGQSEAGKSTLLKNFQLHFAPKAFHAEAEAWRAVIHLNLVRAVNFILESLHIPTQAPSPASSSVSYRSTSSLSTVSSGSRHGNSDALRALRMRLSPLRQVELILHRRLSVEGPSPTSPREQERGQPSAPPRQPDLAVKVRSGWKALARIRRPTSSTNQDELQDTRQIIDACADDIVALWADESVQAGLRERKIDLEDHYIFFLDNASRVSSLRYIPSTEDILRARLQTIGVEEHRLALETVDAGSEWIFYDVEGCRGQRAAWAPFFDDVNAMIFLCPMSNFDVTLKEDPTINSLLDSFNLWKSICESKLLADATFILFLNKMDLLNKKLKSGVKFSDYVSVYKDQPNDAENIALYFRRKLSAVHKHASPKARALHIHMTCAIDTKTMSTILKRVKDVILITTLKDTAMI